MILVLGVLPNVLSTRNIDILLQFEQQFEKIGMPALVVQVGTGLWMAHALLTDIGTWFTFDNDLSILTNLKLLLLLMTIIVALHARFRVILTLSPNTLNAFAINIILITLLSVSFVIVGTLFRTGFT